MEFIALLILIGIWVLAAGQTATIDAINNSNSCCDYTPWHWTDETWYGEEKHDHPPIPPHIMEERRAKQIERDKASAERIARYKEKYGERWFVEMSKAG